MKSHYFPRFGFLNFVIAFCICALIGTVTGDARECFPQKFLETFMWGVSSSGFQSEGSNPASQWTQWAASGHTQDQPGLAADFLHRYKEDIRLAKKDADQYLQNRH